MTACVVQYLVFSVVFGISLIVIWSFFFLPLDCLPLELRLQVTSLVSTNFSSSYSDNASRTIWCRLLIFVLLDVTLIVAIDGRKCWTTLTPQKPQGYTRFSWRVSNICSTSDTHRANPVTNHARRQQGYTRFCWRVGNICSTSGTRLTNPVTNHVRRRDNGVTPGSSEE